MRADCGSLGYEELERAFAAQWGQASPHPSQRSPTGRRRRSATRLQRTWRKGPFRLVIAVDEITDELKRTVLYINRHTVAEIRLLALELRYAEHEGVEILLPEVYGEESAIEVPRARSQWDEA